MCIRDSYLRDRTGKSARIAEKIRKKIGIDVDVKPETVTEENLAPAEKENAPETVKEATPTVETKKEEAPKTEMKKEAPKAETKAEKKLENLQEEK